MSEKETRLVIGIDFGTTYSGVSWALTTQPDQVEVVSQWDSEGIRNSDLDKIPTRISYSKSGELSAWGFDLKPRDIEVSWFKLLLSNATKKKVELHKGHSNLFDIMTSLGKLPVEVSGDYLGELWKHALKVLKDKIGEALVDNIKIDVVLTVPALWDHQGQSLTCSAATRAGITTRPLTTLKTVSEPEAAAVAALHDRWNLKVGQTFVVCDCGGGTVDLISYKVEALKPLRLTMCTEPTGGLFGATFLDDAFLSLVISMIGARAYGRLTQRSKDKIMEQWEHGMKRNFVDNGVIGNEWIVDIPGYLGPSGPPTPRSAESSDDFDLITMSPIEAGLVRLNHNQLKAIFESVCPRIVNLVKAQVEAVQHFTLSLPNNILLVGGFGENRYLLQELKSAFPNVEVIQPSRAWSVISRGAVYWGLDLDVVQNFIAKYNYGIRVLAEFDECKHREQDRTWDPLRGVWEGKEMEWYLRRAQNISKEKSVKKSFCRRVTSATELANLDVDISYSDCINASILPTPDVKHLCTIKTSLDPKLWDILRAIRSPTGVSYRIVNFSIEMLATSGSLTWILYQHGTEKGRTIVDVEYQ